MSCLAPPDGIAEIMGKARALQQFSKQLLGPISRANSSSSASRLLVQAGLCLS
jgi:hypothetical protein